MHINISNTHNCKTNTLKKTKIKIKVLEMVKELNDVKISLEKFFCKMFTRIFKERKKCNTEK